MPLVSFPANGPVARDQNQFVPNGALKTFIFLLLNRTPTLLLLLFMVAPF
jgi:hypothetical protein